MLIHATTAILWLLSAPKSPAPNLEEGQWDITIQMEFEADPWPGDPFFTSGCMTRDNPIPSVSKPGQKCEVTQKKVKGNRLDWSIECDDLVGATLVGHGTVTFKKNRLSGTMQVSAEGLMRSNMKYRISGKRVGACKQPSTHDSGTDEAAAPR